MGRWIAVASVLALAALPAQPAADPPAPGTAARPAVPHYVSLAAEGANGRRGPGLEYGVEWIYERAGLPLQVMAERGPWRHVRDPDGAQVWIHARNLDPRRTAYVTREAALRRSAREGARPVALLSAGVIGVLTGCEGDWRRIAVGGRVGWVKRDLLWGADDCAGL